MAACWVDRSYRAWTGSKRLARGRPIDDPITDICNQHGRVWRPGEALSPRTLVLAVPTSLASPYLNLIGVFIFRLQALNLERPYRARRLKARANKAVKGARFQPLDPFSLFLTEV